jgi:chromosome segregation ATPase
MRRSSARDPLPRARRPSTLGLPSSRTDRDKAAADHAELLGQIDALAGRKEQLTTELAGLDAEVRHQEAVFATLEVLKKEQGFLRELIGSMVDEGSAARDRVRDLRQESEALFAQQLEIEKELVGKQAELDVIDKAILAKSQELEGKPAVSDARAF